MNEKKDYSENIIIPEEIEEKYQKHYAVLESAKKIIKILSLSPSLVGVENYPSYTILPGSSKTTELPRNYIFGQFHIRFLPGWGSYIVIFDDDKKEISIKKPRGKEEFEKDVAKIQQFIKEYSKLPLHENFPKIPRDSHSQYPIVRTDITKRQLALIAFRNELRKDGRSI